MDDRTVSDLGEFGLIERAVAAFGKPRPPEIWSGDDCAVLAVGSELVLLTTDVLVEGVDFEGRWADGGDVGWKCVAINASDVAAMGGVPTRALVTLVLPAGTPISYVDGVVEGLAESAVAHGIEIVGGDVSRGGELSLSGALMGRLDGAPVTRAGAAPGDAVCVTGSLGGAAAGLEILKGETSHEGAAVDRLRARQLRPRARIAEGPLIARAGATAMIDVSDGLIADLGHLLDSSGLGCVLDAGSVPLDADATAVFGPERAGSFALGGGEDFELLFTIAPERVDEVSEALSPLDTLVTVLGRTGEGPRTFGGVELRDLKETGWDHLRNP